jgi:tryptophan halogenase
LLSQTLKTPYVSYADNLFCDRAWAGRFDRDGEIRPYTTTATMDHGWSWRIEFENHVTRGYVFSSQFCADDTAADELVRSCPELKKEDLRLLKFPRGRYESYWVGNVAAIGNASGFVEPLEATALHMISEQLRGLCESLADCNGRSVPAMRDLQNRRFRNLWDDICGFLAVHYKFNYHRDTPFWKHCHNDTDLTVAADFVEAYQQAGPSPWISKLLSDSIFGFAGYACMLIGQKVPTEFDTGSLNGELARWESLCRSHDQDAKWAIPVRESLRLVKSPNWPWKAG